jgi:Outer membrane protein beta-barrel domain
MNKKLLLLAIATISMVNTKAQGIKKTNVSIINFGAKLGANSSNVYDSKGQDFIANSKAGLTFGGFVQIPISSFIGIQGEILFSQKGFKGKGTLLSNPYNYTRTTNYLDIPILLALKPVEAFTVVLGPQYSYLLSEKNVFTNTLYTTVQEQQFNNDNIRKNTLCFLGGVDVNLQKFVISARAGWDIRNNAGDGTNNTPRYKNIWYQATLGYRF